MKKSLVLSSLFLMNYAVIHNAAWQKIKNDWMGTAAVAQEQDQLDKAELNKKIDELKLDLQEWMKFNVELSEKIKWMRSQINYLKADLAEMEPSLEFSKRQEKMRLAELLRLQDLLQKSSSSIKKHGAFSPND